ncbi:hypothetical protein DB41_FH00030 [Neochlamydia sp. TUME1]|nr:hypothetical protein DB41_FH00030 [Neochlamydia sp. TUME1]
MTKHSLTSLKLKKFNEKQDCKRFMPRNKSFILNSICLKIMQKNYNSCFFKFIFI